MRIARGQGEVVDLAGAENLARRRPSPFVKRTHHSVLD